jgi:hypothetical protein
VSNPLSMSPPQESLPRIRPMFRPQGTYPTIGR